MNNIKKTKNNTVKSPRKINKVKVVLLSTLFIICVFGGYKLIQFTYNYFHSHTYINLKVNFSIQLPKMITNEEYQKQLDQDKQVEEMSDKAIELLQKELEPKKETSLKIVKPVLAETNYTYTKHSDKKYYNEVISGLKTRYTNWEDAAELISKESGFDIGVINKTSGACGLPQALPCKKMKCSLTNIDCQLDWQKEYITNRYGTIEKALKFHKINNWY